MERLEIGKEFPGGFGRREGVAFDLDDSGAMLVTFFNDPDRDEIEQFKQGKRFEIRFTELYDIIMITAKIGNLNWIDAPYNPHLSKSLTKFDIPGEGQGLGLTLILVDTRTGKIENMRLLGLSERFSRRLLGSVMEQKMKPFDQSAYDESIVRIYSAYSTNQIVKLSKDYCKMND